MADWLALVIGNSRWHWAWFQEMNLRWVGHAPHRHQSPATSLNTLLPDHAPPELHAISSQPLTVWAVSVVPAQRAYLNRPLNVHWIQQLPLKNIYPTMGLDRRVSLWGAGQHYSWPVLVIDSGTALTFTAGADASFKGGAILLGLRSHFRALHHYTAALPPIEPPTDLPPPWAMTTPDAIQSGVLYPLLAGIHHYIQTWQQQYPNTNLIFTGGDGEYLHRLYQTYLQQQNQVLHNRTWFDANLMFWGIAAYRNEATREL
ncbi:pantothenate kinase [Leptothoe kymatousa]|uniref:Type III pantothenate kinase n=1 Tax=Leptothoe kymatousa TAU-MAC 1615 TaxID=2364775 RepID=A0ABS5Y8N8_9CYAN|nr:pantothenate kinase [Leptothoe kymatousa]MBT9313315.1 pantothenate kinase [Leptothoe kymatousa TAU-MAC 1615]